MKESMRSASSHEQLEVSREAVRGSLNQALETIGGVRGEELLERLAPVFDAIQSAEECDGVVNALGRIPSQLGDPLANVDLLGQLSVSLARNGREIRDRSSDSRLPEHEAQRWYKCGEKIWEVASELAEWCPQKDDIF